MSKADWRPAVSGEGQAFGTEDGGPMNEVLAVLTDGTFDEEVKGSVQPLLVDFWAEWCGPCKMVTPPTWRSWQPSTPGGSASPSSMSTPNPAAAARLEIIRIPTMIVFHDGEPKKHITGALRKAQILQDLSVLVALHRPLHDP